MIAHPHGLIFIHVPKCAGMSVEAVLGGLPARQRQEQHWSADRYRRFYPEEWEAYHAFALVRHPEARCRSYLRFYRRWDPIWRRHLNHVDEDLLMRDVLFSNTVLTHTSADRMIDGDEVEVLRLEDLDREWPAFAKRHGLPARLPRRNRSHGPQPELSRLFPYLVAAIFPNDYEQFGYERPDPSQADLTLEERGTLCWAELLTWARSLPPRWTPDVVAGAQTWLDEWRERLPEHAWRERYDSLVSDTPPPMTDTISMLQWVSALHERVNEVLGKRLWQPWVP